VHSLINKDYYILAEICHKKSIIFYDVHYIALQTGHMLKIMANKKDAENM
jgi:hypothetical protein